MNCPECRSENVWPTTEEDEDGLVDGKVKLELSEEPVIISTR